MTPTLRTGKSTAKACHTLVVETRRADLFVDDGVGLAQHVEALVRDLAEAAHGQARARGTDGARARRAACRAPRPTRRTSSLKSSRSGSMSLSFMRSGRPPTLWWLLITALGPLHADALDHVRVERALHQVFRVFDVGWRASSNTSMNSLPMILRFFSGSVTPARPR